MGVNNVNQDSVVDRLAEKGLDGYDTQEAYAAVELMYDDDGEEMVESFIEPLEEFDEDNYTGHEPLSTFDQKFNELLERHSGDAEEAVYGYELANEVVEAEERAESHEALEDFEDWSKEKLDGMLKNTGMVLGEIGQLEDDEYREAVLFHGLRRIVQHKYNHQPWNSEKFELSDP